MNWKCQITGNVYPGGDQRLAGYGNPPRTPLEPGMGGCPMVPTLESPGGKQKGVSLNEISHKTIEKFNASK